MKLICINCPKGCEMEVTVEHDGEDAIVTHRHLHLAALRTVNANHLHLKPCFRF